MLLYKITAFHSFKICAIQSFKHHSLFLSRTFIPKNSSSSQKKILPINNHIIQFTSNISWTSCIIALSQSAPVLKFQEFLIYAHEYTGLPWWMIIMLTTFSIRAFIVFPLTIHQNQVICRLDNLNKELLKMAPDLNREVNIAAKMYNLDKETAKKIFKKSMQDYYQKYVERDNCHPFKSIILIFFQVPLWICFSMSLRNITFRNNMSFSQAELIYSQLSEEGVLWFTNLTIPDGIFIPLLLVLVNFALIEIHALRHLGKGSLLQKIMLNTMRCVSLVLFAAATINPSSMTFYWLCSSIFGFCQNIILMTPAVRRKLNIPATSYERANPLADIVKNFKEKFKK